MLYNKDWAYKLSPVADVLFKAADLLEQRGHTKWTRLDDSGRMCFLGALECAQGHEIGYVLGKRDSEITVEASRVVAQTLGLKLKAHEARDIGTNDYRKVMIDWNNNAARTGQEVIDAMRMTASKLMEKTSA